MWGEGDREEGGGRIEVDRRVLQSCRCLPVLTIFLCTISSSCGYSQSSCCVSKTSWTLSGHLPGHRASHIGWSEAERIGVKAAPQRTKDTERPPHLSQRVLGRFPVMGALVTTVLSTCSSSSAEARQDLDSPASPETSSFLHIRALSGVPC